MPRSAITLTAHVLIFYPFDGPEVQLDCPKLGPTVWTSAGGVGAWFERVHALSSDVEELKGVGKNVDELPRLT